MCVCVCACVRVCVCVFFLKLLGAFLVFMFTRQEKLTESPLGTEPLSAAGAPVTSQDPTQSSSVSPFLSSLFYLNLKTAVPDPTALGVM